MLDPDESHKILSEIPRHAARKLTLFFMGNFVLCQSDMVEARQQVKLCLFSQSHMRVSRVLILVLYYHYTLTNMFSAWYTCVE